MRLQKFALAVACVLGLFGFSSANSAEPVKIRMSWVAPVANWASIVLEKKDLAKHLGKSYILEPVRYQGTPPMITAIANNEGKGFDRMCDPTFNAPALQGALTNALPNAPLAGQWFPEQFVQLVQNAFPAIQP